MVDEVLGGASATGGTKMGDVGLGLRIPVIVISQSG